MLNRFIAASRYPAAEQSFHQGLRHFRRLAQQAAAPKAVGQVVPTVGVLRVSGGRPLVWTNKDLFKKRRWEVVNRKKCLKLKMYQCRFGKLYEILWNIMVKMESRPKPNITEVSLPAILKGKVEAMPEKKRPKACRDGAKTQLSNRIRRWYTKPQQSNSFFECNCCFWLPP